jgi:hypothetical protein
LVTPHGLGAEGVEDGGDVGEQGGRGWVRERSQTRIVWRDLNPVWKQEFNWEILNPDEEVIHRRIAHIPPGPVQIFGAKNPKNRDKICDEIGET